jgi:hypothetical protein
MPISSSSGVDSIGKSSIGGRLEVLDFAVNIDKGVDTDDIGDGGC